MQDGITIAGACQGNARQPSSTALANTQPSPFFIVKAADPANPVLETVFLENQTFSQFSLRYFDTTTHTMTVTLQNAQILELETLEVRGQRYERLTLNYTSFELMYDAAGGATVSVLWGALD